LLDRAFVLLDLDGTNHAEIAGVPGTSASRVGTMLHRTKTRLCEAGARLAEVGRSEGEA
jgi:DNA-directed RNA polymerase specialized sigma24 family protein